MATKKTKEQQQQQLQAIAKEYASNQKFKQQIDTAYEAAKQQSPEQISQLESQYKENSKIVFAYMMIEQQEQQKANQPYAAASGLPRYSKEGSKFEYIQALNGKCPEGYEVEKYFTGGCVKCRKGNNTKDMITSLRENMKTRFNKCGAKVKTVKCGNKINKKAMGGQINNPLTQLLQPYLQNTTIAPEMTEWNKALSLTGNPAIYQQYFNRGYGN